MKAKDKNFNVYLCFESGRVVVKRVIAKTVTTAKFLALLEVPSESRNLVKSSYVERLPA